MNSKDDWRNIEADYQRERRLEESQLKWNNDMKSRDVSKPKRSLFSVSSVSTPSASASSGDIIVKTDRKGNTWIRARAPKTESLFGTHRPFLAIMV